MVSLLVLDDCAISSIVDVDLRYVYPSLYACIWIYYPVYDTAAIHV